ncbi:MAG TPA: hypothetical protein VJT74_12155 [Pyrinomonadaceae bacterium]|nr:hypothetical protein [Pyrinomonadaceae bacterium]
MNPDPAHENRFKLHQVIDRGHNGVVVSVFEYPAGWEARSDVTWNFQNATVPVTAFAQAYNPAGTEAIGFLPPEIYFWLNEGVGFYVPGQEVQGTLFLMPMPAADALAQFVVPKYRGRYPDLRIVGGGPVPQQLAQRLGVNLGGAQTEDAYVRLEYTENGRLFEEEFYGMKFSQDVPYYGPQGTWVQTNWGFARLFSFRAEKGALDAARETFRHIAGSVKVNPRWEQLYAQVLQQLKAAFDQQIQAGYDNIRLAGEISRGISAQNDALLASFEQQRRQAQQASERHDAPDRSSSEAFDEYVRGVETVNDPYSGESQQDYNYQYHWTNGSGEYQHSNDPFFNPNVGSNQNWTIMEPKKR